MSVQLPAPAVNVTLPAFARRTLLLTTGVAVQQLIDISCLPGPRQQTRSIGMQRPNGTDGRTDERTDSFVDCIAMRAVSILNKWLLEMVSCARSYPADSVG